MGQFSLDTPARLFYKALNLVMDNWLFISLGEPQALNI